MLPGVVVQGDELRRSGGDGSGGELGE